MELRQLRYFVMLAEELHFGRAAKRLALTQPPLSQAILNLERDLGVRLFDRTRRSVALTHAGKAFLGEARQTLARADRAVDHAQRAGRGEVGRLAVGFLANSTSGAFLTVPFTATVPVGLSGTQFQSSSVIQRRYDLAAAIGIPLGAVSNAQIKFSFPAENFQNEITSIEIAGDTN